jgi:hypothetical protein
MVIPIGLGLLGAIFLGGLAIDSFKPAAAMILLVLAAVMMLVGGIGCLITAFRESAVCGLLYMFVPFGIYALYFVFTRLDQTRNYLAIYILGLICIGGGFVLMPRHAM